MYRAVTAGLGAHVVSHLAASLVSRRYTPGVVTAVPVMLPGAIVAARELAADGRALTTEDLRRGAVYLLSTALAAHLLVRIPRGLQRET